MGAVRLELTKVKDREIYSLMQLPLCDTPMLEKGIEPSTIRLQVGRSTN